MRPYVTEILIAFAAGWCVGHYTTKDIPTIAEVKQEVAAHPEAAKEIVKKREPVFQYGDGKLTINVGKMRK
jgi:hypothetical protein